MKTKYSFKKSSRLLHKKQFQAVASSKDRSVGKLLVINVLQTHSEEAKLGITVTKRFGKAHLRNRFKRKVREAFRLLEIPSHVHILVKPKLGAQEVYQASMQEFQRDILQSLKSNLCFLADIV